MADVHLTFDSRKHAEAIISLFPNQLPAFTPDKVPGNTLGAPGGARGIFATVLVMRAYLKPIRMGGRSTMTMNRAMIRCIGTTVAEVEYAQNIVANSLDSVCLNIDGKASSPVMFEADTPIEFDEGFQSSMSTWTYSLT